MKLDPKEAVAKAIFDEWVQHASAVSPDFILVSWDDGADKPFWRLVAQSAITAYLSNLQPSKEVRELVEELRSTLDRITSEERSPGYFAVSMPQDMRKGARTLIARAADLLSRMDGEGWRPTDSAPDGWKLVPIRPTVAMLKAAADEFARVRRAHDAPAIGCDYYSAMLAAAPSPSIEDPTQGSPAGGMLP